MLARTRSSRQALRALLVTLALTATAACGSSSSGGAAPSSPSPAASTTASSPSADAFPATVTADNGPVTVAARPKAIVSLSPTLTDMLFELGAGSQVKAVDALSDVPKEAPRTTLSGFQPNAEAIAGYAPDLVVVSYDIGGLVSALGKLKVPVLLLGAPRTIADSYTQELALGRATGHVAEAQRVADATRAQIAEAVASVPKGAAPGRVYHEVDQTYYSVTSATFIGDLYRQFGLVNIADSAPQAAGGYPKLSAEFVVKAAPTLIVLADEGCCHQTAATVAARPAFATIPAVATHRVLAVDDDTASRWGPSLGVFADKIAVILTAAR